MVSVGPMAMAVPPVPFLHPAIALGVVAAAGFLAPAVDLQGVVHFRVFQEARLEADSVVVVAPDGLEVVAAVVAIAAVAAAGLGRTASPPAVVAAPSMRAPTRS